MSYGKGMSNRNDMNRGKDKSCGKDMERAEVIGRAWII